MVDGEWHMLRLFFRRDSRIVRVLEVLGIALLGWLLWRGGWRDWSAVQVAALWGFLALVAFLRFCATKQWYPRSASCVLRPAPCVPRRDPVDVRRTTYAGRAGCFGIETHFRRAYVPVPYIMTCVGCWCLAGYPPGILYLVIPLLLLIAYSFVVLLYLHRKDRDCTPVNYFSNYSGQARPPSLYARHAAVAGIDDAVRLG